MMRTEDDVLRLIQSDDWMMEIIRTASTLNLPDWWICAGFIRSKIWDTLHGFRYRTPIPDVDVIYFDKANLAEKHEKELENKLIKMMPAIPWSVKNEARMHIPNQLPPYTSSEDAMSKFPETATALGIKLDDDLGLVLSAPCGIEDVLQLEVRPTPFFNERKELAPLYEKRITQKHWKAIWPKLKVCPMTDRGNSRN